MHSTLNVLPQFVKFNRTKDNTYRIITWHTEFDCVIMNKISCETNIHFYPSFKAKYVWTITKLWCLYFNISIFCNSHLVVYFKMFISQFVWCNSTLKWPFCVFYLTFRMKSNANSWTTFFFWLQFAVEFALHFNFKSQCNGCIVLYSNSKRALNYNGMAFHNVQTNPLVRFIQRLWIKLQFSLCFIFIYEFFSRSHIDGNQYKIISVTIIRWHFFITININLLSILQIIVIHFFVSCLVWK